jgi:hypothetical protein
MTLTILDSEEAIEAFYKIYRDPRLATLKKDATVPKVGDTVTLNDRGIQQCFGSAFGLGHMKSLKMRVTHVDDESMTYPEPTFVVDVDNPDINMLLIDHTCFDIIKD